MNWYTLGCHAAFENLGVAPSAKQMLEALKGMKPSLMRQGYALGGIEQLRELDLPSLKKLYRSTFNPSVAQDVPLGTRLKSYKRWKETGRLPQLEGEGLSSGRSYPYERSNEPITLYSGGTEAGFRHGARQADAGFPGRFLIPGETKATSRGMWATRPQATPRGVANTRETSEMYARMAAGQSSIDRSAPTVAKITVPRKHVVYNSSDLSGEAMLPPDAYRHARVSLEPVPPEVRTAPKPTPASRPTPAPKPVPAPAQIPRTTPTAWRAPVTRSTFPGPTTPRFNEEMAAWFRGKDLESLQKFRGDHARNLSEKRIRELLPPAEAEQMLRERAEAETKWQELMNPRRR